MIIKDMRNERIINIFHTDDIYHPAYYHTHSITDVSREVTDDDIKSCKVKAISENAVCMMIMNYGITWYIPNN